VASPRSSFVNADAHPLPGGAGNRVPTSSGKILCQRSRPGDFAVSDDRGVERLESPVIVCLSTEVKWFDAAGIARPRPFIDVFSFKPEAEVEDDKDFC